MQYTSSDVIKFAKENDVKFIRLAFCDVFGTLKNLSVMSDELPRAFERGILFDVNAVTGYRDTEDTELLLFPDPSTLTVLPWRPQQGRVVRLFCDIRRPDGTPFAGDNRAILKNTLKKAQDMGYTCHIGTDCEFYLFEADENGNPTRKPHDLARYFDVAPLDRGENVRRDICLTLEEMDIKPQSSHHEKGPGQNEIDFKSSTALRAADNFATFRSVVKTMASRNGLYASFMPKPMYDESGSGLHIKLSLYRGITNVFQCTEQGLSPEARSFIAGVLRYAREMSVFLNPLTNSYARLTAPEGLNRIAWGYRNLSQIVRIPTICDDLAHLVLRSSDPSCNPYIVFALVLSAGLEGIEKGYELADELFCDSAACLTDAALLPAALNEAIKEGSESEFLSSVLPDRLIDSYLSAKRREWDTYTTRKDKEVIEREMYFNII